jgi:amino acid transporter
MALSLCLIILLTNGFVVFTEGHWNNAAFISAYLDIPLVLVAYFAWKLYKKTKIISLDSIPIIGALEQIGLYSNEPEPKQRGWIRLVSWIWE